MALSSTHLRLVYSTNNPKLTKRFASFGSELIATWSLAAMTNDLKELHTLRPIHAAVAGRLIADLLNNARHQPGIPSAHLPKLPTQRP